MPSVLSEAYHSVVDTGRGRRHAPYTDAAADRRGDTQNGDSTCASSEAFTEYSIGRSLYVQSRFRRIRPDTNAPAVFHVQSASRNGGGVDLEFSPREPEASIDV